ncbi:MAG: nucleoside hydrolase [Firmicutes bacterium]|uniref:Purine nucleosidase n=1 Tax=Melghirimyces thermohalophilus TaxID=1236220 RepID=A0A1G6RT21_9BACL|nr:nucleoside hydrolase [Melghirimyces thermohalophilus]MDA8353392.1 nucleoside hydrolase [Bacillota bacterium]SDD07698.1 purine nucleosidase [Melghirimyces thermohalophilus]
MNPILLDVDTGIDDALAIAYAVHSPELEILGITTCFGNASVEETTRNTLQVLEVLGAEEIPVIAGAGNTLAGYPPREKASWIHGENGLGDVKLPLPTRRPLDGNAAQFIISEVRRRPHEVTLITVGSLVNLATALRQDPEIAGLLKQVVVMGGAVTVPGNITPHAEANIHADPEAADVVFRSGVPITLVGLDVTMKTLLRRERLEDWRRENTEVSWFLADICDFYMNAYHQEVDASLGGCALHDPLTVGIVIDPSFVRTTPMKVRVITEGEERGRTVGSEHLSSHVQVALKVDSDRFVSHFLSRVVPQVSFSQS